jgi:nucleotide-binding universal stress UspA family protein
LKKKPEITLMHVRDTDDQESQEFADACVLKGESALSKLEHKPQTKLIEGNVVDEVVREIALNNYDLVVLGAQGFGKSGRFNILSERSLQIIRRTNRPVLLYRPKA